MTRPCSTRRLGELGPVDAMLNVAGIDGPLPLADLDMAPYDPVMDVDLPRRLLGPRHAMHARLESGRESIINWSALAGLDAALAMSVYWVAKGGVIAVTKAAAGEYGT
jgi:NAD(P)-dependent dehydrogenase (short-subunit alcohol dehydrogenase family)